MNREAFFVIGSFTLMLGILHVPTRWWAKRKLRNLSLESNARLHITATGFVFCGLMTAGLLIGMSYEYMRAGSEFGRFVGTPHGRLIFAAVWTSVWLLLERGLKKLGVTFVKHENSDV